MAGDHDKARKGLLNLPAEIRNYIYELAMEPGEVCVRVAQVQHRFRRLGRIHINFGLHDHGKLIIPPLVQVSQQIRNEPLPMFYGQSTFIAYNHPDWFPKEAHYANLEFEHWLGKIGEEQRNMIKNVVVRIPMPVSECTAKAVKDRPCVRPCWKNWHPTSAEEIVRSLKLGIKDSIIKIEFGATVNGKFWRESVKTFEDLDRFEWKAFEWKAFE